MAWHSSRIVAAAAALLALIKSCQHDAVYGEGARRAGRAKREPAECASGAHGRASNVPGQGSSRAKGRARPSACDGSASCTCSGDSLVPRGGAVPSGHETLAVLGVLVRATLPRGTALKVCILGDARSHRDNGDSSKAPPSHVQTLEPPRQEVCVYYYTQGLTAPRRRRRGRNGLRSAPTPSGTRAPRATDNLTHGNRG
jgi:hypothetical protein